MADDFVVELRIDLNAANLNAELSRALGNINNQFTGFDGKIQKTQKSLDGAARSVNQFAGGASNARYALYDVSTTLATTAAALTGIAVGTAAVAIAWERDFANVARTSGLVGDELAGMREELVGLAQTMPAAFGDITRIATLGAQLGVAADDLAQFTETVIAFSAATGITAEESAQAFGRLGNILGVAADNYDNLGSSIVKAGVSAVATEGEIVAVAQQIGPIARLAGASADEVVGLATAMASVKIPPELARSVITKVFGDITRAVGQGGEKLEAFGAALGMSGQEFARAWNSNATDTFVQFLDAIPTSGTEAVRFLDNLGIVSRRDVPALQKLAQNVGLVEKSLRESATGYSENTELQRQYGIISETTAARLQVLANNFQAFLDAVGSANLGPLTTIIDGLSEMLKALTAIASTDIGGNILGFLTVLAGAAGVLAAFGAGLALFGASSLAMQQGLQAIATIAPRATAAILGSGAASQIAAGQMTGAALAAKTFRGALGLLAAAALVVASIEIGNWAEDWIRAATGVDTLAGATADAVSRIEDSAPRIQTYLDEIGRGVTGAANMLTGELKTGLGEFFTQINEAIDAGDIETATRSYQKVRDALYEIGVPGEVVGQVLGDIRSRLDETTPAAEEATDALGGLEDAETAAADAADVFAASMGMTAESVAQMAENIQSGSEAFFDMAAAIEEATSDAGFSISTFIEELQAQVDAQTGFADNLGALAARGAVNFASELSKGGPEAAEAAAALVGASDEELARLEELATIRAQNSSENYANTFTANVPLLQAAYAYGGDAAVASMQVALGKGSGAVTAELIKWRDKAKSLPMEIYANNANALATLNALQRQINATTGTVHIYAQYSSGALQAIRDPATYARGMGRAAGGPVYGPGTATSDSIPVRLSDGEYVVKAAAHDYYGTGLMDAINSMRLPKFANGGAVSSTSTGSGMPMMGAVVELGPKTMARMNRDITNNILLDKEGLSRAVEEGNRARRFKGDM